MDRLWKDLRFSWHCVADRIAVHCFRRRRFLALGARSASTRWVGALTGVPRWWGNSVARPAQMTTDLPLAPVH